MNRKTDMNHYVFFIIFENQCMNIQQTQGLGVSDMVFNATFNHIYYFL